MDLSLNDVFKNSMIFLVNQPAYSLAYIFNKSTSFLLLLSPQAPSFFRAPLGLNLTLLQIQSVPLQGDSELSVLRPASHVG